MRHNQAKKPHAQKTAAPTTTSESDASKSHDANEGEGNRTAARRYDAATVAYIESGRSVPAAKAAAKAIDGPEGAELRAADAFGKKGHPKRSGS